MRLHVIQKALVPLCVHFGKPRPLETKTERRLDLRIFIRGRPLVIYQRLAQRTQQHSWYVANDGKLFFTSRAFKIEVAVGLRGLVAYTQLALRKLDSGGFRSVFLLRASLNLK